MRMKRTKKDTETLIIIIRWFTVISVLIIFSSIPLAMVSFMSAFLAVVLGSVSMLMCVEACKNLERELEILEKIDDISNKTSSQVQPSANNS